MTEPSSEELVNLRKAAKSIRQTNVRDWRAQLAAALILDYLDADSPTKARDLVEALATNGAEVLATNGAGDS